MGAESSQSLEQIANGLFDELGFKDGDETTFDKGAYSPNGNVLDDLGEQENNTELKEKEPAPAQERLYAGQFKTANEMEAAFLARAEKPAGSKPDVEEIPDLTRELLTTLHEQDDSDGTTFTVEYLQRKMAGRNLTDFEIEKLKELDVSGKDLYGSYVSIRTERDVMSKIGPVIKPIQDRQNQENYNDYMENEKAIFSTLETSYEKSELATLKQKTSDPKFIETVLRQSEFGQAITSMFQAGSKATAYKMLMRETKDYIGKQTAGINRDKTARSIPADVGAKADPAKKRNAASIQEAFDDSLQELNY